MKKLNLSIVSLLSLSLLACDPSMPDMSQYFNKNLAKNQKTDASKVASAQSVTNEKDILAVLTKKAPQLASLNPTIKWNPNVNMYELIAGLQVVYISRDGKNLFQGHIISIDTGKDYTDFKIAELSKINTDTLPMKYSIKIKNGDGSSPLYIFSPLDDNLKSYYQNTLSQLNNVTMYFFLSPALDKADDDGYAKEYKTRVFNWVYCSDDQSRELSNFLNNKTSKYAPITNQTDDCGQKNDDLGKQKLEQSFKIMYVPTLFTSDGNRYQPQNLTTLQQLIKVTVIKSPESNTLTSKKTSSNPIK